MEPDSGFGAATSEEVQSPVTHHQKRVEHLLQKVEPVAHHGISGPNIYDQIWNNLGTVGLPSDQESDDSEMEDENEDVIIHDGEKGIMDQPDGQRAEEPIRNEVAVGDMKSTDDGSMHRLNKKFDALAANR